MADGYKLYQACPQCGGAGVLTVSDGPDGETKEIVCFRCSGNKYFFLGWCTADTFTMPDMPE